MKNKIELLKVEFYTVDAGWIRYKLTAGKQSFEDRFSEVFDPMPDLKHWLEAISIGVQQTSFQYDNEGNEIKFDFERVSWDSETLIISDAYEDKNVFIKVNIKRQQIIKAFYHGLLNFARSDKFQSNQWEVEYLKERLCKNLNMDEDSLIQQLTQLDRKELGDLLFNADPTYTISYPDANDKNQEFAMFVQDTINGENRITSDKKRIETRVEWNIPSNYNFGTREKKQKFVINCINEKTNGYGGMKINDFRSSIIEKYLEKE